MAPPPARSHMATRSKSSQRWLKEHFSDPYVKNAQAEGLRSLFGTMETQTEKEDPQPQVVVALGLRMTN